MIIQLGYRDRSGQHSILQLLAVEIIHGLFVVQPRRRGLNRAVSSTPIGYHEAFELPLLLEDVGKQIFILARKVTIDRVVSTHHGAWVTSRDADLECEQVALLHGTLSDNYIDLVTSAFLVIHCVVLNVGDDMLRLFAFDPV